MKRPCICAEDTPDAKRGAAGAAVLSLNVGGCRFQVSRATAGRIPYFEPYLEGRLPFVCDEEGWIFVDRCGELFKYVLQFARDNRRPSRNVLFQHKDALLAECEFYALDALAHHLREETSPWDLRPEDRRIMEAELHARLAPDEVVLLDVFAQEHAPLEREALQLHCLLDSEPRAAVVGDFAAFYDRLDAFSGGILEDLARFRDVVIAGGAVAAALTKTTSSDLDLFLLCPPAQAEGRLRDIYGVVQNNLRARCGGHAKLLAIRSSAAVTFHHCLGTEAVAGPPVQVVLALGGSVADVLLHFDVDCCCAAYIPSDRKTLCTRRGLRALRHGANIVDSAFGGPSYARRLQKYAGRGFAAAVPHFQPERTAPELLRSNYAYFEHSGMLLRLGRQAALSDAPEGTGIQMVVCQHATAVENLQRLVVLDAGAPIVSYHDNDRIRRGASVCIPLRTGEPGKYIVAFGCVPASATEIATTNEDSDLYVSLGGLVPGIVEKVCRVAEEREDPPSPEGWRAGGVVRRSVGGGLRVAGDTDEPSAMAGHEQIVCVYDLVTCGATFESLRYVLDARQPPNDALTAGLFERRHGFPAALKWRQQTDRTRVPEFTKGVYL
jgi:hypothetical protein